MTDRQLVDRTEAWSAIGHLDAEPITFDAGELTALPGPARRFLEQALPTGEVAAGPVLLEMEGEIKLRGWMPFTARQILHPSGFVWNATVGRRWLRFRGGDAYWRGRGSLDFRLVGLVPVVRAAGPDVDRSAAGRLAAEIVAWAPEALVPAAGATWRPVSDDRATVSRRIDGEPVEVTLTVDDDGVLRELATMRWGNPAGKDFGLHPFGGSVTEVGTFDGITVATAGSVGWWWGTDRQADGEFFRYRILDLDHLRRGVG